MALENIEAKLTVNYADQASFPDADANHGRVVHSHADGAQYYSHGSTWIKLANDSQIASLQADIDQNEADCDAAVAAANVAMLNAVALVKTNFTASRLRGFLGITENNGDPGDGRGVYFDTGSSKYLTSS